MARGKKKATVAEAPPSTPPAAKKLKTSTLVAELSSTKDEHVVYTGTNGVGRTSTRSSTRTAKTNSKKRPAAKNVWDQERCEEWFDGYASQEDANVINPTGFQRFCEDLNVDLTGIMPFIISWKLGATIVFHITREQWIHGMKTLKVDTLTKMKEILSSLQKYTTQDVAEETFAEIYHWTFLYLRENGMRKVIDIDTAIPVLQVLFENRENKHIGPFLDFLKQSPPPIKSLNKDQWDSFYVFSRSVDIEFTGYSEDAAWPILLDDYVKWKQQGW